MEITSEVTKTSPQRIAAMIDACKRIERDDIPGDIVECGVWRGGNIILARREAPGRVCWLYDTFTGMTEPGPLDVSMSGNRIPAGKSACSVDEVRGWLGKYGALDDTFLRWIEGDVCETLRHPANLPAHIALLRLDTDFYASTRAELEVLYPLLSPGGVLIIDDYGHWRGCRKAVDEYFRGSLQFTQIDYSAIMAVKPC